MNIAPFSPVKFRINVFYCKLWTPRTAFAVVWADNVHPKSCVETKIDSHAHVERDPIFHEAQTHSMDFNSHAHVERDMWRSRPQSRLSISTHTLTWSVTFYMKYAFPSFWISTHTLTWSVTEFVCKKCHDNFISTHTLTWSVTFVGAQCPLEIKISTHTLTWSVTSAIRGRVRCKTISTHTLTWSVTMFTGLYARQIYDFNSHAHVERDSIFPKDAQTTFISTHTLTWSVTRHWPQAMHLWIFQLTRSRGAWLQRRNFKIFVCYFNSHAHVERDGKANLWTTAKCDFNSHAHVERDAPIRRRNMRDFLFQLTRSRGAWHI